jgi:HEAT repeat protein
MKRCQCLQSATLWVVVWVLVFLCETAVFGTENEKRDKCNLEHGVIEEALEFILAERRPNGSVNHAKLESSAQALIDANATTTVPILTEFIVSTRGQNNSSRRAALMVVSAIGDTKVVDLLVEEYDSAQYGWEVAVDGLRRLAPREFSQKLLQDIQAGEITYAYKNCYTKSIKAFVQVGDSSRIPEVIALLDSPQRVAAARILYWMPDERAIPALRKALALPGARNFNTHAWAAHALHRLGIDEGLDVLINDLREASGLNPHSTGKAIAAIAGEDALELYRPLLTDESARTRRNALVAMQWMLDNTDQTAPPRIREQIRAYVMSPQEAQEFLEVCCPLLRDAESHVVGQARNIFLKAQQTAGRTRVVNEEMAMSIARVLWSEFFAIPERQKQLLRKYLPIKKGQPVRLGFSDNSSMDSKLGVYIPGYSQQYVVLCAEEEITLIEKNVSPKPVSISVNRISQIGTFHVVTMQIPDRIIHVLLRQENGDWKWEAPLGAPVICVW